MSSPLPVHYLPIATTILSAAFLAVLIRRAIPRRWPPHMVRWGIGVLTYGLGTAVESAITLGGNTTGLNRLWYWAGAILGGYPLATGSVYLLMRRSRAHLFTAVSLALVLFASVAILLTPINQAGLNPHKPSGSVIEWRWIRYLTPFINLYAAVFLIGGAGYSSYYFFRRGDQPLRAAGTALIAAGGLLPGIGGAMAKAGTVEALYIGEFLGLILIWFGYELCVKSSRPASHPVQSLGSADPRADPALG